MEEFKNREKCEYLTMSKEQFIITLQNEHFRDWRILYETIAQREREEILAQLRLITNAWSSSRLSDNSAWNRGLSQCIHALNTYIKKLEE